MWGNTGNWCAGKEWLFFSCHKHVSLSLLGRKSPSKVVPLNLITIAEVFNSSFYAKTYEGEWVLGKCINLMQKLLNCDYLDDKLLHFTFHEGVLLYSPADDTSTTLINSEELVRKSLQYVNFVHAIV